ncbi:MAG TPA: serine hydrolase [Verrucomicrobiae bacterium]|nr:serine hydrolase [Verrucomicrobiae bacterium]
MNRKTNLLALAVTLCAGVVLCCESSGEESPKSAYDLKPVTDQIQSWVNRGYYPGAGLLISKDNRTICERYFGSYDTGTVVYIASAGKWLAAATIAAVVDDGKLRWDDPVAKWLPEFADAKGKATLRQLLSHTSGFPDYQPRDAHRDDYQSLGEAVTHMVSLPPTFPPGAHFQYGGLAMQVAGRMAELASGRDWESLFQEKIAHPLGMGSTQFTPVDPTPGHNPMLGGGARSTLPDYARFLAMINGAGVYEGKRILSSNSIREMQADQVRGAVVDAGKEYVEKARGTTYNGIYGLGEWREELNTKGEAVLISSPSWAGAYPWIDKTCGVYGIFLTHVDVPAAAKDKFNAFYASPVIPMLVRQIIRNGSAVAGRPEHPQILVVNSDRDVIRAKIEQAPWAQRAYRALKTRVDSYVELCRTNEQFMSSRLFMNWQTHYITPVAKNSRTVGGEGTAPVPTPRFGGARDWATRYQAPARLEDLRPYNDNNGKVWLFNKARGKEEWADPAQTGRLFETVNERIIQTAADAGFVYWLTGDESYARYASEILWTYMRGFSYMLPPKIMQGGGEQIIGFDSFEVIHEDIVMPLSLSYDFTCDYLQKQGTDVELIQQQFKRMADRVIDGGSSQGNWNLNQARIIAYAGLALEDNAHYADGKGRRYYVDVVLNARLPAQTGLTHVIKEGYDEESGIWPEAPGYSFGTTKDIALIASLLGGDGAGRALLADPILPKAILAQTSLTYPNGYSVGLGDTVNTRVNSVALELLVAAARQRGDTAVEDRLTAVLQREIALGYYNRSRDVNLVALTKYVAELRNVPPAASNGERTYFGRALNVLMQRNLADKPEYSLAAAMYGTRGGHVHANGLAMELYGAGLTLGADPGRGSSYWQPEHGQYYSQPPAHNTVIVNGRSDYSISRNSQIAMNVDLAEPSPGESGVSPDIGFAQASFHYETPAADQQRTQALIRIGPQAGFYWDVFRSRALDVTNSFHDYLYHNIGQSLVLKDKGGSNLPLAPTDFLSSTNGRLKGYDYFRDETSAEFAGDLHGVFTTRLTGGPTRLMNLWMVGEPGRRMFSVSAPADHAAREELHGKLDELPMPTLIVRQQGDAWRRPFVVVFEPCMESDGASVRSVRGGETRAGDEELAACVVEWRCSETGQKSACRALLMQDDDPTRERQVEGCTFQGVFGAVISRDGIPSELYLGHGRSIGTAMVSATSAGDGPVSLSLVHDAEGWRCTANAPVKVNVTANGKTKTSVVPAGRDVRVRLGQAE